MRKKAQPQVFDLRWRDINILRQIISLRSLHSSLTNIREVGFEEMANGDLKPFLTNEIEQLGKAAINALIQ